MRSNGWISYPVLQVDLTPGRHTQTEQQHKNACSAVGRIMCPQRVHTSYIHKHTKNCMRLGHGKTGFKHLRFIYVPCACGLLINVYPFCHWEKERNVAGGLFPLKCLLSDEIAFEINTLQATKERRALSFHYIFFTAASPVLCQCPAPLCI